jgi:oligopeptidase B
MTHPPKPPKKTHKETVHGQERIDHYHWMRDRENPEVIEHLKAENAFAEEGLKPVDSLKDKLFEEITSRIKQTDMSVPYTLNGYRYYHRYEEGKEYAMHFRSELHSGEEQLLIDENERAEDKAFYQLGAMKMGPGNRRLAFAEDTLSRRIYTIGIKDLEERTELSDRLLGASGSMAWSACEGFLFYVTKDPQTLRPYQVFRHKIGDSQEKDELIFEEDDERFYVEIKSSKSRKYLLIGSSSTLTSEYRYLPSDEPESAPRIFTERQRGLEYEVDHLGEYFYVLHNGDGRNFSISKASGAHTLKEAWTPFIAHREDVLLEGMELFNDFIAIEERKEGLIHLRIARWENVDMEEFVPITDPAYSAYISVNPEPDSTKLRYGFSSMTVPNSVYEFDTETKQIALLKQEEVVGGYDPESYRAERHMVKVRDGVEVPVSIVYPGKFQKDGNAPLLLYGYGSYGLSLDPYFSISRLSLLDRGFAFAIAHIRGGEELGRSWYENGRQMQKKNTFHDFIDVAEFLISQKYTSEKHLYAMGGSAGGLLMGTVINMRPDLWNGVVAQVPFVDVINTMLDETIPLTTGEYDEWGNPNEREAFEYILSYSPYDNVKEQNYPALLVTTGFHDSQVQYWEPMKWVAKLRDYNQSDEPIYFVTDLEAGHGGASGRFRRFKEIALEYSFLLMREGIFD